MIRRILEDVDNSYATVRSALETRGWKLVNSWVGTKFIRHISNYRTVRIDYFEGPIQGMTVELWRQLIWNPEPNEEQEWETDLLEVHVEVDPYYIDHRFGKLWKLPLERDSKPDKIRTMASPTRRGVFTRINHMEKLYGLPLVDRRQR